MQTLVCAKDRLFLQLVVAILLDCGAELFHLSSLSLGERGSERMGKREGDLMSGILIVLLIG